MHNTCGITCAHSLVVLKHLKQRLFHRNFFHSRWDRVTQVEFDTSVTGYKPQILHPSIIGEFASIAPECSELADFEAESDSAHVEEPDIDLPTHHAPLKTLLCTIDMFLSILQSTHHILH